ncbi:MAG: hypothetical protein WBG38_15375, partial [Nodosilinea sp.]
MINKFFHHLPIANPGRSAIIAAAMASFGLLAGTGELTTTMGSIPVGAALAQDSVVSSEEVIGYATSVLEMDIHRTEALSEIRTLLTGTGQELNTIDMSCAGTATLNQLPRNLR